MNTLSGRLGPPAIAVLFPAALSFEISSSFFASSALSSRKELALIALDFVVGAMLRGKAKYGIRFPQRSFYLIQVPDNPDELVEDDLDAVPPRATHAK